MSEPSTLEVARCVPFLVGWPGGFLRLERVVVAGEGSTWRRDWYRVSSIDWIARTFLGTDDCFFSAVPHPERNGWPGVRSSALWVRTESKRSEAALRWFKPRPTLVLGEGDTCRRAAVWALTDLLPAEWTVRLNRRIAHALRAPKKHCGMDSMLPAPGAILREGREKRPALVRVESWRPDAVYGAREVAGHLKEAPDADAWREAAGWA